MTNLETIELMQQYHVAAIPIGGQWIAGVPSTSVSGAVDSGMFLCTMPAWRSAPTIDEAVRLAVDAEAVRRRAQGEL